jgi:hypothetical protein
MDNICMDNIYASSHLEWIALLHSHLELRAEPGEHRNTVDCRGHVHLSLLAHAQRIAVLDTEANLPRE